MNDNLKITINRLQSRIVPPYESDNILLIFDDLIKMEKYMKFNEYMAPDLILKTISDICSTNGLLGIKYKRYWFVTDKELEEMERKWTYKQEITEALKK